MSLPKRTVTCQRCKKERIHYAKGLCRSCYHRCLRLDNSIAHEKQKIVEKNWRGKNKAYWDKYYSDHQAVINERAKKYYQDNKDRIRGRRNAK